METNSYAFSSNKNRRTYLNVVEPAGFWVRVGSTIVDWFLVGIVTIPLLLLIYGKSYFSDERLVKGFADFILSWCIPALYAILFWLSKQASPGKSAVGIKIVDAKTGLPPTAIQCTLRYLGYFISALPLGLGFVWIALNQRKQGWHDMISNTLVVSSIRTPSNSHSNSITIEPINDIAVENPAQAPRQFGTKELVIAIIIALMTFQLMNRIADSIREYIAIKAFEKSMLEMNRSLDQQQREIQEQINRSFK